MHPNKCISDSSLRHHTSLSNVCYFKMAFKIADVNAFSFIIKLSSVKSKDHFNYFQKSEMNNLVSFGEIGNIA